MRFGLLPLPSVGCWRCCGYKFTSNGALVACGAGANDAKNLTMQQIRGAAAKTPIKGHAHAAATK